MTLYSPFRYTKIICTLGPSSRTSEQLVALAEAGMNIARINCSHGERDQHKALIKAVREASEKTGKQIGIMLDTRGAEIRTGDVMNPIDVDSGDVICFVAEGSKGLDNHTIIEVNYDGFCKDVAETDRILVDNGEMSFSIEEINDAGYVLAKAQQSGKIGSRRHINLPGADVDLPTITAKDWADIEFGIEEGLAFIALSFVRNADDIVQVRKKFASHERLPALLAKIETKQSLENIDAIIEESDGILIARGDLGAEVPFETLPTVQDDIVMRCRHAGKTVIVATHMLESMREHPVPTRAEITDVSHAATLYADATMLSAETASGNHPVTAVEAMGKILHEREAHNLEFNTPGLPETRHDKDAQAQAALALVDESGAKAILLFTHSGSTAKAMSRYRPGVPIVGCTDYEHIARLLTIEFGVEPFMVPFSELEETVSKGIDVGKKAGIFDAGDKIVVMSDAPTGTDKVPSVQLRTV